MEKGRSRNEEIAGFCEKSRECSSQGFSVSQWCKILQIIPPSPKVQENRVERKKNGRMNIFRNWPDVQFSLAGIYLSIYQIIIIM